MGTYQTHSIVSYPLLSSSSHSGASTIVESVLALGDRPKDVFMLKNQQLIENVYEISGQENSIKILSSHVGDTKIIDRIIDAFLGQSLFIRMLFNQNGIPIIGTSSISNPEFECLIPKDYLTAINLITYKKDILPVNKNNQRLMWGLVTPDGKIKAFQSYTQAFHEPLIPIILNMIYYLFGVTAEKPPYTNTEDFIMTKEGLALFTAMLLMSYNYPDELAQNAAKALARNVDIIGRDRFAIPKFNTNLLNPKLTQFASTTFFSETTPFGTLSEIEEDDDLDQFPLFSEEFDIHDLLSCYSNPKKMHKFIARHKLTVIHENNLLNRVLKEDDLYIFYFDKVNFKLTSWFLLQHIRAAFIFCKVLYLVVGDRVPVSSYPAIEDAVKKRTSFPNIICGNKSDMLAFMIQ